MWQQHGFFLLFLALFALPVWWVDQHFLRPVGGFLPVDLRGALVAVYGGWLVLHILISSGMLRWWEGHGLYATHAIAALLATLALAAGVVAYSQWDHQQSRHDYEEKTLKRAALAKVITLESWRYVPDASSAQAVVAVVRVSQKGRFAAGISGRQGGTDGGMVFSGEPESQQIMHEAGQVTVEIPLQYYTAPTPVDWVELRFHLFPAEGGAGISKLYLPSPAVADDGQFFYAPLPRSNT